MATPEEAILALKSCITIAGVWVVMRCWKSYLLDSLRQRLFAIRDDLFDFAGAGGLSFDNPGYKTTRDRINSVIRYAHLFTMRRMIVALEFLRNPNPQMTNDIWVSLNADLNTAPSLEARQKLKAVNAKISRLLIAHIIRSSAPPFTDLLVYTLRGLGFHSLKALFTHPVELLEAQAGALEHFHVRSAA